VEPQEWVALDVESPAGSTEPRWRVRVAPLPWRKRWFDRRLAQADVTAPDGSFYHVRVLRNVPFRRSPLGPLDNMLPMHVTLPVLVGANAYTRGRTGWVVEVFTAETAWRAKRVIYVRRVRDGVDVADTAIELALAVKRGERPWKDDEHTGILVRLRRIMNWY
jgi:hypothetical protein